jgi:hypothetical protein
VEGYETPLIESDVARKITTCLKRVLDLLVIFGFGPQGYSLDSTVDYYVRLTAQVKKPDPWIDVMKLALADFIALSLDNERPPNPLVGWKSGYLLLGRAYRFVRSLRRRSCAGFFDFISSVGKLKRSFPLPGKDRVAFGVEDMKKKVFYAPPEIPTRLPYGICEDPAGSPLVDDSFEPGVSRMRVVNPPHSERTFDSSDFAFSGEFEWKAVGRGLLTEHLLKEECSRRAFEVFRGTTWGKEDIEEVFFPSTSANYVFSRSNGGTVAALYCDPEILQVMSDYWTINGSVDLEKLLSLKVLNVEQKFESVSWDDSNVKEAFCRLYLHVYYAAKEEENTVFTVGLSEALKVRVITKSPAYRTFVLKPLQRHLHNVLRRHPTFQLVGTPVNTRIIDKVLRKELNRDERYLSGDYSDATNCLRSSLSDATAEAISATLGLGPDLSAMLIASLTGHTLNDSPAIRPMDRHPMRVGQPWVDLPNDFFYVEQKNGQLMGSVTSFIVLCIVNAAVCGAAIEAAKATSIELKRMPLLINGDDCLFVANRNCKEIWTRLGKIAGLEPSTGKCFWHKTFLQINSQNFYRVEPYVNYYLKNESSDWPEAIPYYSKFKRCKFIALNLVFGIPRSCAEGTDEDYAKISTLSTRQSELLEHSPIDLKQRVNNFFYKENRDLINNSNLPWFVPRGYGGLGLRPRDMAVEDATSTLDKMICSGLLNNRLKRSEEHPRMLNPKNKWTLTGFKNRLLKCYNIEFTNSDHEQLTLPEFENNLSVACLFHKPQDYWAGWMGNLKIPVFYDPDMKDEKVKNLFQNDLKHNVRFWRKAHLPSTWKVKLTQTSQVPVEPFQRIKGLHKIDSSEKVNTYLGSFSTMICAI